MKNVSYNTQQLSKNNNQFNGTKIRQKHLHSTRLGKQMKEAVNKTARSW